MCRMRDEANSSKAYFDRPTKKKNEMTVHDSTEID